MRGDVQFLKRSYEALFDRNVAGVIVTNADGQILDCNAVCAGIFGFNSREEMLKHSAWDFYFDPADRESMIEELRTDGVHRPREIRMRRADGSPVWLMVVRTALDTESDCNELFQGTMIDISPWRRHRTHTADESDQSAASTYDGTARFEVQERLKILLQKLNILLNSEKLLKASIETREVLLVLEEIKMLVLKLELDWL